MRPVPPSIDKRSQTQKNLDEAVKAMHKEYGDGIQGYILIAYGNDYQTPTVSLETTIYPHEIPEYASDVLKSIILEKQELA